MVSSIVPGTAPGANALGIDHRLHRGNSTAAERRQDAPGQGDSIDISAASLAVARESVRAGLDQVGQALALGRDAQAMLVNVQALARDGAGQGELDGVLAAFTKRVEAVAAQGARLVLGEDVSIQAEPGGAPLRAPGVDLRLKAAPRAGDVLQVSADAQIDDPALLQAAQRSLETLQMAMGRLLDVARALEAHHGFIGAAESAVAASVRNDVDAEGARLLALQVSQGLEAAGGRAIANAEPQAVLALFRA